MPDDESMFSDFLEPVSIQCPECDVWFYVVWHLDPVAQGPEYCPFCGSEIDYRKLTEDQAPCPK